MAKSINLLFLNTFKPAETNGGLGGYGVSADMTADMN
jgi:hypothetical protein